MPRPIIKGEKRALSKLIAEYLADKAYALDISGEPSYRGWAYRKAAWAVEDTEQDIGCIYDQLGVKGLVSIQGIGSKLASEVETSINQIRAKNPD
jgi:DNA polymerase/3'-5' exonuclease PolX